jgi:hypothetical protein
VAKVRVSEVLHSFHLIRRKIFYALQGLQAKKIQNLS